MGGLHGYTAQRSGEPGHDERCTESHSHDAVVLGGGAIGLAIAWRASAAGMGVGLVDPEPGRGASWAAAGMLAAVSELHHGEEPLLWLNLESARRWPSFAAELESTTGLDVGYLPCGTLVVACDHADRAWAERLFELHQELGLEVEWLSARRLRELEPNISPHASGGLLVAGDHQVDNRLLVSALIEAARRSGCCFHRLRARSVEFDAGKVSGVKLVDGSRIATGAVVLASGAWSTCIDGIPAEAVPPIRPVKGQILRMRTSSGDRFLSRSVRGIVNGSGVYIVPRADGTVVVGATMEEKGFDTSVTAGAVYELLRDACRVVPGVAELELTESCAGLRPGSPDNSPVLGAHSPGVAGGLLVASGHYRNGILLTPLTADALASMLRGADPPEQVLPFSPSRFEAPRSHTTSSRASPLQVPSC